jgi:hypothetical protein
MSKLIPYATVIAAAYAVSSMLFNGFAVAAGNPAGTGQPSQTCVTTQSAANEPGHAASASGSAFNENGGTAGAVYAGNGISATKANSSNAVSQYDVACFQVTSNLTH